MRKEIYNLIKESLLLIKDDSGENKIKHIDFWNDQIRYIANEKPFFTPAVFVEFSPIEWRNQLKGIREANIWFKLHVVTRNTTGNWEEVIESFEMLEDIYKTLHGVRTDRIGSITITASDTDHDFDELREDIETYCCHVTTDSIK